MTRHTQLSTRYVVLAKRPSEYGPDGFDYQPAGSVWPTREPVENHRDYCQACAEADRQRYRDVEYVIGRIEIEEEA